ncbi:phytanoyl-CoA dioxygenase family protein [Candidatus Thioglobus sp.]|nr:phytanoyl-CoA dioxygenase family protein [Candidatus Thioglobus sp.]
MSKLTSFFLPKIKKIGKFILFRDKKLFYYDHFGTLNFFRLVILNVIAPGRILNRIRYKRFPIRNSTMNVLNDSIVINPHKVNPEDLVNLTADTIRKHGAAVVDGFFSENYLEEFRKKHSSFFPPPIDESNDPHLINPEKWMGKTMSLDIQDLWMNDFIVKVIQNYIGRLPYARNYPVVAETRPRRKTSSLVRSKNIAKGSRQEYGSGAGALSWHVDHSCLIQAAVYFDDVVPDGSHMEIVSGTHKLPCISSNHSDETVEKSRWASKILPCVGKKGSIQFHCGNVLHRLNAKPLSSRCWLKFEYTSGPNIALTPTGIASLLDCSSNYEDLTPERKQIISGLLPLKVNKGYEPYRGGFIPTRYKGI